MKAVPVLVPFYGPDGSAAMVDWAWVPRRRVLLRLRGRRLLRSRPDAPCRPSNPY